MLILLDIDGVMLPAKSWSSPTLLDDGFSVFNSKSVEALNQVIEATNADIILTTSHKVRYSIEEWVNILESRGVIVNNLSKLPQIDGNVTRLEEINRWYLNNEDVKDFVIIDDDKVLNGLSDYLKSRLVLTKSLIGFNNSHIQEAIEILNTPLEFA